MVNKLSNLQRQCLLLVAFLFASTIVNAQGIDKPRYQILTTRAGNYLGTFNIELFPLVAPNHVNNFDSLANALAFDSTAFHRVVPGFVIQGGDPNSINGPISTWGNGNPNQPTVNAEFSAVRHLRGIIGAARDTNINSASSQFYVCVANSTFLDGQYTVFGRVTEGMEVVDTIVASPRDVNDVPLQKIEMFVTYLGVNDTIPNAPTQTLPANHATGVLATTPYQWTAVPEAILYTVEFSTDSLFSSIYFSKTTALTYIQSPTFLGYTKYYWRVRSNNGGHESLNSTVFDFTTIAGAPELLFPADSSTNIVTNPTFLWNAANGATSYTLQVATATSFSGTYLIHNVTGLTTTSQQFSLNPNTRYYWRMRSLDGTVLGPWSAKYTFVTGTTAGIGSISEYNSLAIYPNPAQEVISIKLPDAINGNIQMRIEDVSGKLVADENYFIPSQEKRILNKDVSTLAKGLYVMSILHDGITYQSKFQKN